jgi:subtilisin-like proprotein convertase family protein
VTVAGLDVQLSARTACEDAATQTICQDGETNVAVADLALGETVFIVLDAFFADEESDTITLTVVEKPLADVGEACVAGTTICRDSACIGGTCANVGFTCNPGEELVIGTSAGLGLAIPDNNATGVSDIIAIADTRTVRRVIVGIDSITHPFVGDLDIRLFGPNGANVELSTDNGGSGDNYTGTVLDDLCVGLGGAIVGKTAPFTNCFSPEGSLAGFAGIPANGPWSLTVADDAGGDLGTLNDWRIGLCVQ